MLHDLPPATEETEGNPSTDGLAQGAQIGSHTECRLHATRLRSEAGQNLIKHQQNALLLSQPPQVCQKAGLREYGAAVIVHGLQDDSSDLRTTAKQGLLCLRKVVPEEIYRLVEEENVSHLCAAPTILISMSTYATTHDVKLKRTLEIMTAGAPPAPTVIQNMESVGANITQTYGLTEVFGPHSICAWQTQWDALALEERAKLKARQGVPFIVAQHMDVVDPKTMEPVPRDGKTIGEIVMRGNNVMLGYYKDPEATATAFEGGWFHSGDLAVMHPDNYAQIMDRKKDIIISGGENNSTV